MNKELNQAEAVVCFAAWLTTRAKPITMGGAHDASEVAELVNIFNVSQGFDPVREDFHHRGKAYPNA